MSLEIERLNEALNINPYFAYQILSNFDDEVLIVLERTEEYKKFFTPIGINTIYKSRFDKLPLTNQQFQDINELQRRTRVSWKNIYLILQIILQLAEMNKFDESVLSSRDLEKKHALMTKLIRYTGENDDLIPIELMHIFDLELGDFKFELLNHALVAAARKVFDYIIFKEKYKISSEDVNTSVFSKNRDWVKYVASHNTEKLTQHDYVGLLFVAYQEEALDILDYLLKEYYYPVSEEDLEEYDTYSPGFRDDIEERLLELGREMI